MVTVAIVVALVALCIWFAATRRHAFLRDVNEAVRSQLGAFNEAGLVDVYMTSSRYAILLKSSLGRASREEAVELLCRQFVEILPQVRAWAQARGLSAAESCVASQSSPGNPGDAAGELTAYREDFLNLLADTLRQWSFPVRFVPSWIELADFERYIESNHRIGCTAGELALRTFLEMLGVLNRHGIDVRPLQEPHRPSCIEMRKEMGI
jgi:hypothetical protein